MTAPLADYATLPLPLTPVEKEQLADYEATIKRGLNTFYEVGSAFVGIKQRKLYRAEYRTFEEYCREKWNITPQHAGRMIAAAEVLDNLKSEPIGSLLPETESQARELKGLEPDQQRQVWQKAVDTAPNGKVTAQHIKDVRQHEIAMPEPAPHPQAAPVHQVNVFVPPPAYESKICDLCKKRFPLGLVTMPDGRHLCMACQALFDDEPAACTACKEAHGNCPDCCYNCSHTCNAQQTCLLHDEPDEREPEAVIKDELEMEPTEHCCTYCHGIDQLYTTGNGLTVCQACIVQQAQADDNRFHFIHQDRARMCSAGLVVLRVDLYKRTILSYDPQKGGSWKLRLKCKNDGEMMDAIARISEEPNTIFENRV